MGVGVGVGVGFGLGVAVTNTVGTGINVGLGVAVGTSTSGKVVREPDERGVATGPLQLTTKKATTIKKAAANALLLILDFIGINHPIAPARGAANVSATPNLYSPLPARILYPIRSTDTSPLPGLVRLTPCRRT